MTLRGVFNWLRQGVSKRKKLVVHTSPEWVSLEKAIVDRDFDSISVHLRAWIQLPEREIKLLLQTGIRAGLDSLLMRKLEILYEYYTNNTATAFEGARTQIEKQGFDADLHIICISCLYENRQFEDAINYISRFSEAELSSSMNRADFWQLVSVVRWAVNDMAGLEAAADRAIELAPNNGAILQTSLGMYIELGVQEKVYELKAKLAEMPDAQGYEYSLSLLAMGEHEQGWEKMEKRYSISQAGRYINQSLSPHRRWQGEVLNGARLLLSAEQGLGDTIQMARYLPMLESIGIGEIIVETQAETLTLLQHNFPNLKIIERKWQKVPPVDFSCWTGMMSLPYLLKCWGPNVPTPSGYLRVPSENASYWTTRIEGFSRSGRPKIGLAWSGQPLHSADRRRSIPVELMMRYVRNFPANFFALQTFVPEQLPQNVANFSEELITLADTAALIDQMDLIITVDTSIVHIAGALGKETWLLLPKRYEWRWGLDGEGNDWYDSVRVLRQTEHANWGAVLKNVFDQRLHQRFGTWG